MIKNNSCLQTLLFQNIFGGNFVPKRSVQQFLTEDPGFPKQGRRVDSGVNLRKEKPEVPIQGVEAKVVDLAVTRYQFRRNEFKGALQKMASYPQKTPAEKAKIRTELKASWKQKYNIDIGEKDPKKDDELFLKLAKKAQEVDEGMDKKDLPGNPYYVEPLVFKAETAPIKGDRIVQNLKKLNAVIDNFPQATPLAPPPVPAGPSTAELIAQDQAARDATRDNQKKAAEKPTESEALEAGKLAFIKTLSSARLRIKNAEPVNKNAPEKPAEEPAVLQPLTELTDQLAKLEEKYKNSLDSKGFEEGVKAIQDTMSREFDLRQGEVISRGLNRIVHEHFEKNGKGANPTILMSDVREEFKKFRFPESDGTAQRQWSFNINGITVNIRRAGDGALKLTLNGDPAATVDVGGKPQKIGEMYPHIGEYLIEKAAKKVTIDIPKNMEEGEEIFDVPPWLVLPLSKLKRAWERSNQKEQNVNLGDGKFYKIDVKGTPGPLQFSRKGESYIVRPFEVKNSNPQDKATVGEKKWGYTIQKLKSTPLSEDISDRNTFAQKESDIGKIHDFSIQPDGTTRLHVSWNNVAGETFIEDGKKVQMDSLALDKDGNGKFVKIDVISKNSDRIIDVTKGADGKLKFVIYKREMNAGSEYLKEGKNQSGEKIQVKTDPIKLIDGEAKNISDLIQKIKDYREKSEVSPSIAERDAQETALFEQRPEAKDKGSGQEALGIPPENSGSPPEKK